MEEKTLEEIVGLEDCPLCDGASILEEEGHGFYAMCLDCGCHTISLNYKDENDKIEKAKKVAYLFNTGKVVSHSPGE